MKTTKSDPSQWCLVTFSAKKNGKVT